MDADGRNKHRLHGTRYGSHPTWSPDGESIAYERGGRLVVTKVDGSSQRWLTEYGASYPEWSPDGSLIIFTFWESSDLGLYTIRPDGSDRRLIRRFDDYFLAKTPSWAPHMRRVVFAGTADFDGQTYHDIYVMNLDGSNLHWLPLDTVTPLETDWFPDGSRIAIRACSSDNEACAVFTMKVDGSDVRSVSHRAGYSDREPDVWTPARAG
jgi:TolB protein